MGAIFIFIICTSKVSKEHAILIEQFRISISVHSPTRKEQIRSPPRQRRSSPPPRARRRTSEDYYVDGRGRRLSPQSDRRNGQLRRMPSRSLLYFKLLTYVQELNAFNN